MADQDFISGALAGQQFQQNKQTMAMNQMLLQEMPVKLEGEKLALKVAQQTYDSKQKMADMLAKNASKIPQGQDPLENTANMLMEMSRDAALSNLPEESIRAAKEASTIFVQRQNAAYKNWQVIHGQAQLGLQLLSTATDPKSWAQANHYYELQTGQPSPAKDQPYSPELVHQLKEAITKKESDAKTALEQAQAARETAAAASDRASIPLKAAQTRLAEARANVAEKHGPGGVIADPKTVSTTIAVMRDVIGEDNLSQVQAKARANDIALDAENRMAANKTLTLDAAVRQAVHARRADLAGFATEHRAAGTVPTNARATPTAKADGKPVVKDGKPVMSTDPKDYKDGQWYKDVPVTDPSSENYGKSVPQWWDQQTQSFYEEGDGPHDEGDE